MNSGSKNAFTGLGRPVSRYALIRPMINDRTTVVPAINIELRIASAGGTKKKDWDGLVNRAS
jgi:hypothetical protein